MSENEKHPPASGLRGAWESFRRNRERQRRSSAPPTGSDERLSLAEIEARKREAEIEPYVTPGLKVAAAWSWRSIVVLVAIGVGLWLLSKISSVLLPVLIALLLSALLAPLSGWMVQKGIPRAAAAAISFIGFIVVVAGLITLVGQQIYSGVPDLVDQVISGVEKISEWISHNPFGLDSSTLSTYLDEAIGTATNYLQNNSSQLLGGAWQATSSVGSFLTGLLLCLFTTYFFLYDGKKIFTWLIHLLPVPAQPSAEGAAVHGWHTLVQYVRVQILVAGVDAIGIGIGAAILGIPLVIPLTVLVFLASFVPIVGAVASGIVAVLVALVSNGFVSAIIMLVVVIAVQQIEGQVLQPFLMGKAVSVHPLAVVLAVAAGAFLFGIVGALFAVPLVAVLNTVVSHIARANSPGPDPATEKAVPALGLAEKSATGQSSPDHSEGASRGSEGADDHRGDQEQPRQV